MKPILFNTEMVKALLDGRKTVTRRPLKGDAREHIQIDVDNSVIGVYDMFEGTVRPVLDYAPYRTGDILYVRETYGTYSTFNGHSYAYKGDYIDFENSEKAKKLVKRWIPSIHMPKEAARIFLRVTGVRVERLQDITWQGAAMEGCQGSTSDEPDPLFHIPTLRGEFQRIWDSTIKTDAHIYDWRANPWVWVIEFERISKEDAYNA